MGEAFPREEVIGKIDTELIERKIAHWAAIVTTWGGRQHNEFTWAWDYCDEVWRVCVTWTT